jgi:hypothetical protein
LVKGTYAPRIKMYFQENIHQGAMFLMGKLSEKHTNHEINFECCTFLENFYLLGQHISNK